MQTVIENADITTEINKIVKENGINRFMLVCGNSFKKREAYQKTIEMKEFACVFSDFTSNPRYDEVCKGVESFRENGCDCIIAVGGGSAIDVAKCIKLFSSMPDDELYFKQKYADNEVLLIAVPTTAGTGSESTKFAVMYYNGEKVSVSSDAILPEYALLDSSFLSDLPVFQKKCTLLDALCQAIESWWSKKSTSESIGYSEKAIRLIINDYRAYVFDNKTESAVNIMLASNLAGRAINITTTTAPHAMSYKLTSMYGLPHGYSVALCLPEVWDAMLKTSECTDARGRSYLDEVFNSIAHAIGAEDVPRAIEIMRTILDEFELDKPYAKDEKDIELLADSVNMERLGNNPVTFDKTDLKRIYNKIVNTRREK